MRSVQILIFLLLFFSLPQTLLARKFDFKNERLSSYISLELNRPNLKTKPFGQSSGIDSDFSKEYKVLSRASLGFVITSSELLSLNLSVGWLWESVKTKGHNSISSLERFELKSHILVFNPTLSLELRLYRSQFQRFYFFLGGGWGLLNLVNEYHFNRPEGLQDLKKEELDDYTENLQSDFISKHIGLGWESLLVDVVTVFLSTGYAHRPIDELKFRKNATTLVEGEVSSGDLAVDHKGHLRKFSLSSFFVQLGFRFYLF